MTGRPRRISGADLARCRDDGLTPTEAAERLDVSRTAITTAERFFGFHLPRAVPGARPAELDIMPTATEFREAVQDMTARDAVEYLLCALEALLPGPDEILARRLSAAGFNMTQGRIVAVLLAAQGRVVSREALHFALYGDSEAAADPKTIDVFLSKIRKKSAALPFKIRTAWGHGWALEKEPGAVMPWESAEVSE